MTKNRVRYAIKGVPALIIIHINNPIYKNFMKETKQYTLKETEDSYKNIKYNNFQRFTEDFRKILKKQKDSGYHYESFPDGEYFHDLETNSNSINISYIEGKYDKAFYYSLEKIHWDLFLSIQFRSSKYNGKSNSAFLNRREFIREFFEEIIGRLDLAQNDLQYFCFEERNSLIGSHFHIIAHCKKPEKISVEQTKQAMLMILEENQHIVIIPTGHTKHVQIVDYSDKVLKYCLKLKLDDTEKPYFHSMGFITFYDRHLKWKEKQKSDSWQTLGSTTSSIGFQNTKNPSIGSVDTPSTEKQSTEAINAFNEPSGIGVTTHYEDLAYLLDGNRAYLVSKPKFYSDESEHKQDMIDHYESIKAEYTDRSVDR